MYGVRPSRYTIEELTAQAARSIQNLPSAAPNPIVWDHIQGRYILNPEYVQFKHGKFQEV